MTTKFLNDVRQSSPPLRTGTSKTACGASGRHWMRKFSTMLFCAAAVAVFATAAFGDDGLDPTLWQNGQGCNASSTPPVATYWCAGTAFAAAPGQTSKTLEF